MPATPAADSPLVPSAAAGSLATALRPALNSAALRRLRSHRMLRRRVYLIQLNARTNSEPQ